MFNHQIASQGHAAHGPESGHLAVVGYAQGLWLGFVVRLKNFHIFPSWTTDRLVMMNCKPHRRETLVYGEIIKIYSACRCTCIIMYSPNS